MSIQSAIAPILKAWRGQSLGLRPGRSEEDVRRAFTSIGASVTADVIALYCTVGGIEMPDDNLWQLWSLEEIVDRYSLSSQFGIEFSDYCYSCWNFRLLPISPTTSAVYIDWYEPEKIPMQIAPSLEQFLEIYSSEPLRMIKPDTRFGAMK